MSAIFRLGVPQTPLPPGVAPALVFHTEFISLDPDGVARLAFPSGTPESTDWLQDQLELRGWGRALTIATTGPERVEDARAAWRSVIASSTWTDQVQAIGSGPLALGALTFSQDSAAESVLIVPQVLWGHSEAGSWVTVCAESAPKLAQILDRIRQSKLPSQDSETTPQQPQNVQVHDGEVSPARYQEAVAEVTALLQAERAQKVVLARDLILKAAQPYSLPGVVSRLRETYPTCWTFCIDGLVGATPELLVRFTAGQITSRVLAGTARRRPEMSEAQISELASWLSHSPKNRREHDFARDSALRALEPLCSQVSASAEPFVLQLPNVLHLASDLQALPAGDTGALALVNALHPTAAVCGTPTPQAAQVIAEVERMDRERYAGPVGWVDWHGEGEWCIALRCGQLADDGSVRVFGGGGIMPDSSPEDELAETQAKLRPMLEALGAA